MYSYVCYKTKVFQPFFLQNRLTEAEENSE